MSGPASRLCAGLDTSVLISTHRHWLWLLALEGYYDGFWCPFIVAELVRVRLQLAARRGLAPDEHRRLINDLINTLSAVLETASYTEAMGAAQGILRDPDDTPVLAAALAANADVVSLNTRDFPPAERALGVRFLTPGTFLRELTLRYPDAATRAARAGRRVP